MCTCNITFGLVLVAQKEIWFAGIKLSPNQYKVHADSQRFVLKNVSPSLNLSANSSGAADRC